MQVEAIYNQDRLDAMEFRAQIRREQGRPSPRCDSGG